MKYKNTGFTIESQKVLEDFNSTAMLLNHESSGAKVFYLENDDDNKVFGIGFRTPPENSKGTPHILEHCVLNGSRKYKTKEPFMDLLKGSLQTFLNAMTFSDKTIYPVASRNDQDFTNLMDVYLDAVFYPRIYDKKEIFLQEGWHYDLKDPSDELRYKGVVYNEMRGAYSSPDSYVYREIDMGLYPDSIYKNDSGGDPYEIPSLTYEEFKDFHKKYYHPSNSYIYLYGKMDLEKQLNHIEEYLKDFKKEEIDSSIKPQKTFTKMKDISSSYPLSPEEEDENKDYLIYAVLTNEKKDLVESMTNVLLRGVLFSNESAPVKNALLQAELGEDISSVSTDAIQQSMGIYAVNTSKDRKEEFFKIIEDTLKDVAEKGIPKNELKAGLNKLEFQLKEADNHPAKGVLYMIQALDGWLYDDNPMNQFEMEEALQVMRDRIETSYYEDYIKERILDNPHKILITMEAKAGMNTDRDKKVAEELQKLKTAFSEKEIEEIIQSNKALEEMQNKEDSPEEKDTIPKLSLEDIEAREMDLPTEEIQEKDGIILYHPLFTQNINYLTFAYDIDFIKEEDVELLSLLSDAIGLMDTQSYTYQDLGTEEYIYSGGIHSCLNTYYDYKTGGYIKKFQMDTKCKTEFLEETLNLLDEMTRKTLFQDKKRFKEVLQLVRIRLENHIVESGHRYGILRNQSYYSQQGVFNERISGIHYYDYIVDLEKNFEDKADTILKNLKDLAEKVFRSENLILNVTCGEEEKEEVLEKVRNYRDQLSIEKLEKQDLKFKLESKKEGISTSANINYVIQTGKVAYPEGYKGSYEVLANILSNTYLYSMIRAQGGAYGTGMSLTSKDNFVLFSYRDPNISETLKVYENLPQVIEEINLPKEELDTFIIGSLNKFDPPLSNPAKGRIALSFYLSGQKTEDIAREMQEAIDTTGDEFKKIAKALKEALSQDNVTVIGNTEKIKEDDKIFKEVRPLKK